MRILSTTQVNEYVRRIGMSVGEWDELQLTGSPREDNQNWINYSAPRDALKLLNFAQHVAAWLPSGEWKLIQLDDSTSVQVDEAFFLSRVLADNGAIVDLSSSRSFLYEFTKADELDAANELLIADALFLLLMFCCHGYIVSSNSGAGRYIAFQDGFVYFYGEDKDIAEASLMLKSIEREPLKSPQWIVDICGKRQDNK